MGMVKYRKCICCRAIIPDGMDSCPNCLVSIAIRDVDTDEIEFDYAAEVE